MSESREDGNNGHLYEEAEEEISEEDPTSSFPSDDTESQNDVDDDRGEVRDIQKSNSSPITPIIYSTKGENNKTTNDHHHQQTLRDNPNGNLNQNNVASKSQILSDNGNATTNTNKATNGKQSFSKIPEKSTSTSISNANSSKTHNAEIIKRNGSAKSSNKNGIGSSSQNVNGSIIDSSIKSRLGEEGSLSSSNRTFKDKQEEDNESSKTNSTSTLTNSKYNQPSSINNHNDVNSRNDQNLKQSANKVTKDRNDGGGVRRSIRNDPSVNEDRNGSPSSSRSPTDNVPKLSPSIKPRNKSNSKGNKIDNRLSVMIPAGTPFESGVNTECIQLLRQLWNTHEDAIGFLANIRQTLSFFRRELRSHENQFQSSHKEKRNSTSNLGVVKPKPFSVSPQTETHRKGRGSTSTDGLDDCESDSMGNYWMPLQTFIDGLKCISESFSDIEKQYLMLSSFQTQCKLVLFAKVKHAKQQVIHDSLSIMHGIQQLISVTLHLLSSSQMWIQNDEESTAKFTHSVFQLTEVYNSCLESSWSMSLENASNNIGSNNDTPSKDPKNPSLPIAANTSTASTSINVPNSRNKPSANSLKVFVQITAANKNDSPLLRLSLKPMSGTRLLQIVAQKRSTYVAHSFSKITLSTFYSDPKEILSVKIYESCFTNEDSRLSPFGKEFSQCPSLLGRAVVKKTENGDQRLSRSTRNKLYSYFHEVLWTLAGEHAEDLLLWGPHSNIIPLVFQPLDTFIALRNSLMLGQHLQDSNLSAMLPAFESVTSSLHSFSLLTNWDEKMREAFEETHRVKRPEHVGLVSKPLPSEWATEIGSKFGEIVTSCISMIDSGSSHHHNNTSNNMRSNAMRISSNEEEPLGNEAQTFFRLEATLVYFKAWVVKRTKVWLNGWAIPQFLACSQRESALLVKLIKSRETVLITRDFLLNHEDISIRLGAKHRKACAEDLREALHQVQIMPEELLQAVGPVCRTLSLATLQSYMPASNHWKAIRRGSRLDPDKPSSYVNVFIGRVIEPVITASVELVPGPVQEAMGKQVVHAACDAWLQYILQRKIRFSECGAIQLLRDFTAFREWIRTETELDNDARKSILQLEILKTCEGVSYLLLRNPGDILGVGKANRKNRRVAPTGSTTSAGADSTEFSPGREDSTADDDIPSEMYVPNQQMWLELRLRRGAFMPPCC